MITSLLHDWENYKRGRVNILHLFIFSLNLPRIQTPAGTTVTNHMHGVNFQTDVIISLEDQKKKLLFFFLTHARSC